MKQKIFLLFALACAMQAMATNLVVVNTDNTQQLRDIATIGKWVFVGETALQLLDHEGQLLAEEQLADIRKIIFTEQDPSTAVETPVQAAQIRIYPNPTHDVLHIQGAETQPLRVFDLQGRLLKTVTGTEITVSDLANGTYLLQIGTQVVRFIKQ